MSDAVITVRMTKAEANMLKQRAKSLGISLAEYIRSIAHRDDTLEEIQQSLLSHHVNVLAAVETLAEKLTDTVRDAMR